MIEGLEEVPQALLPEGRCPSGPGCRGALSAHTAPRGRDLRYAAMSTRTSMTCGAVALVPEPTIVRHLPTMSALPGA